MEIQDQDGRLQALQDSITSENLSNLVCILQTQPESPFEIPAKQLSAIFSLMTSFLDSDPPLSQGEEIFNLISALQHFESTIIPIKLYEAIISLQDEPIAYRLREQLFLETADFDLVDER